MALDRQARERIEDLRAKLYDGARGSLDPEQVARLLPISRELDRLSVEFLRERWQRADRNAADPKATGQESGQRR